MSIVAPPLNDVRIAVWSRIDTDNNTSSYTLMKEGRPASMPYLVVGPAYKGAGGTDPELGVNVVVQIEAYALATGGGTFKVSEMIVAVYAALSTSRLSIQGFDVSEAMTEEDTLHANLTDEFTNEMYAQRTVRFRFQVHT